jgi:ribulose kinase
MHADIPAAMAAMSRAGRIIPPGGAELRAYHDAKYAVFQRMHRDQLDYRGLMASQG